MCVCLCVHACVCVYVYVSLCVYAVNYPICYDNCETNLRFSCTHVGIASRPTCRMDGAIYMRQRLRTVLQMLRQHVGTKPVKPVFPSPYCGA